MNGFRPAPWCARAALLLPVLLLGGCDILGDLEEEEPSMSVSPSSVTVVEGRVLGVVVSSNMDLCVWPMGWGQTDQRIALVDTVDITADCRAIAHVHGIGPGRAEIHFGVNAAGKVASATLSVTVRAVTLRSLTLEPDSLTIASGGEFWIVPHARDSVGWDLLDQPIDWQVSDTSVVSFRFLSGWYWGESEIAPPGSALFLANKAGEVTITASLEGLSSSSVIHVTETQL